MKIKKVLEELRILLSNWGIKENQWILTAQYAQRLLGYDVQVRQGHLNIILLKNKIPWEYEEELEVHAPSGTKYIRQVEKFTKKTDFEFDLIPLTPKKFRKRLQHSVQYPLPGGKNILLLTPKAQLEELDHLFSMCTNKGWGKEKGIRVMPAVVDQWKAILKKKEYKLAKAYERLIRKYDYFRKPAKSKLTKNLSKVNELEGIIASKGRVKGKVNVVLNPEVTKSFKKREILVTSMTSPKYTFFIHNASALVTDEGGTLCHAAIVSRELGIPCIVGTKIATKVLKDGDLVEVDAVKGVVKKLKCTEYNCRKK